MGCCQDSPTGCSFASKYESLNPLGSVIRRFIQLFFNFKKLKVFAKERNSISNSSQSSQSLYFNCLNWFSFQYMTFFYNFSNPQNFDWKNSIKS